MGDDDIVAYLIDEDRRLEEMEPMDEEKVFFSKNASKGIGKPKNISIVRSSDTQRTHLSKSWLEHSPRSVPT